MSPGIGLMKRRLEKENLNDEVEKLRKQIDEIQKNLNTKS